MIASSPRNGFHSVPNYCYATEAAAAIRDYGFKSLEIQRLVSLIDPGNVASERVAVKLCMEYETDTVRPNGRTMRVYAITRA